MAKKRKPICQTLDLNWGPNIREFAQAQNHICPLCGHKFDKARYTENRDTRAKGGRAAHPSLTFDHVIPHTKGGSILGNVLLVHAKCNEGRGNKSPSSTYIKILELVNERLGWDPKDKHYKNASAYIKSRDLIIELSLVYRKIGVVKETLRRCHTFSVFDFSSAEQAEIMLKHLSAMYDTVKTEVTKMSTDSVRVKYMTKDPKPQFAHVL